MATLAGTPCPTCQKPKGARRWKPGLTEYVALIAHNGTDPHEYSVCLKCFRKQWRKVYKTKAQV